MRQELDLFTLSIDSFYGRIGNVFLSTMFEIQRLLDDLAIEEKLLNETLVDAALTRDTFAKAMDIIYGSAPDNPDPCGRGLNGAIIF